MLELVDRYGEVHKSQVIAELMRRIPPEKLIRSYIDYKVGTPATDDVMMFRAARHLNALSVWSLTKGGKKPQIVVCGTRNDRSYRKATQE